MSLLNIIIKTIKYSARFGGKLSLKQLYFRLLSPNIYSIDEIKKTIQANKIVLDDTLNLESNNKILLAKKLLKNHLSKFNDILFLGITGSTAAENAKSEEDIDLFIICKSNSLWWNRLKLRLYIKFNNIPHRRYGQKEIANDFCFNLWMDEANLLVPKLKQNQKNAVDLIMMKVILNKNHAYEEFIRKNNWAKKYVANGYNQLKIKNYKLRINKNKNSIMNKYLNYIAFCGQYLYIRLKGPVKFINYRQAFFHK
jgi:hypothetical protein